MPWTLLGPLEVGAWWPRIQGRESVAELAPDFLVKPLILPNACFCLFQVVVLGPPCHQLWAFPSPAAQPRSPAPPPQVASGKGTGRTGAGPRALWQVEAERGDEPLLSLPGRGPFREPSLGWPGQTEPWHGPWTEAAEPLVQPAPQRDLREPGDAPALRGLRKWGAAASAKGGAASRGSGCPEGAHGSPQF